MTSEQTLDRPGIRSLKLLHIGLRSLTWDAILQFMQILILYTQIKPIRKVVVKTLH